MSKFILTVIVASAAPGLAFITGLLTFKRLTPFFKVIFLQVMIYLVVQYIAIDFALLRSKSNHQVYNIYMPVEMALLLGSAAIYFRRLTERRILLLGFLLFLMVYLVQIVDNPSNSLAWKASVAEGIIMLVIYLIILKIQFSAPDSTPRASPLVWLCLGSVLYFGCTIPLFSSFEFAFVKFPTEVSKLFNSIVYVTAIIRYLFVAISFWLCFKIPNHSLKIKS